MSATTSSGAFAERRRPVKALLRRWPTAFALALLAEYEEQSARYRRLVSDHDLNSKAKRPVSDGRHVDLRWVILHLIEETSRHNGHLDAVRELVDGRTGA